VVSLACVRKGRHESDSRQTRFEYVVVMGTELSVVRDEYPRVFVFVRGANLDLPRL
jgi:hypothetical protein